MARERPDGNPPLFQESSKILITFLVHAIASNHYTITMSRAHMLYDNKPLESIPVTPVRWEKRWEPEQVFCLHRFVFELILNSFYSPYLLRCKNKQG